MTTTQTIEQKKTKKPRTVSKKTSDKFYYEDYYPADVKNHVLHSFVKKFDPYDIKIGWRARVDIGDINELIASIGHIGQIQPIIVSVDEKGDYELIAGMRRLTACKSLGIEVIAVVVESMQELHTLDVQLEENLSRKNFDKLELAEGLSRRKKIYEQQYPETVCGNSGNQRDKKTIAKQMGRDEPAERFTKNIAKKLNLSETKVTDILQLAKLSDEQKQQLKELKSTKQREKTIQKLIKELREEKKIKKLQEKAAENKPENLPFTEDKPILLYLKDNEEWLKENSDKKIDLILTDPPYGTGKKSNVQYNERTDISKNFGDWDNFDVSWVEKFAPLLVENGQLIAFCPVEAIGAYREAFLRAGLTYRCSVIWHKTNPGTIHRPTYLSSVEAIVWATAGKNYYFRHWANGGDREVHNMIEGPICQGNERVGEHPTQKPLYIIEQILSRHCGPHMQVLDPFCGTGTVPVACRRQKISCIGIEREQKFHDTAVLRVKAEE